MISIDYETYLIGKGAIFPKPVCLSYYDGVNTGLLNSADTKDYLHEILIKKESIIAHHAVFECGVTAYHYPELTELMFDALDSGLIICTKIAEQLNNTVRKTQIKNLSLAGLVNHYFDIDISSSKTNPDAWRLRYSELDGVLISDWPEEAKKYAIDDSIWAYKVREIQDKADQVLCIQAAVYLNLMGSVGIDVDLDRVRQLKQEVSSHLKPHYEYLVGLGLCVVNKKGGFSKKVKKLQEYVESLDVLKVYTTTGQISVDAESLEKYLAQIEDPVLKSFSYLAIYEKIQSAYLSRMTESPIYTQYSAVKSTGRTSANGTKLFPSLNIQQMPRQVKEVSYDVRNCIVPPKGYKILSNDYSALEMCATAHQLYKLYGKSAMRDALNEGEVPLDMHSKLGAYINKTTYEDFISNPTENKPLRQKAKRIDLSFAGGVGYNTMRTMMRQDGIKTEYKILETYKTRREASIDLFELARQDLRIDRTGKYEYSLVKDELVKLKRDFLNLYPELEWFLKESHLKFLTGEKKYVKDEFGEWKEEPMYAYTVLGFTRDWCVYTALCNGYLMQTPAAIGAKVAVNRIIRKYWKNPDVIPWAFIHDEILFLIRESKEMYNQAEQLSYEMIDAMKEILSSVRITVEASFSDQWQKSDGFWTKKFWR